MPEKSDCFVCREPVKDQAIRAIGHTWHNECFILMPFPEGKLFEHEGRVYCENDYTLLFGERCAHCYQTIIGKFVSALGFKWHPEHFCCDVCNKQLSGSSFLKHGNKPFCKECYEAFKKKELQKEANRCAKCKKPIKPEDILVVNGTKYHSYHFKCNLCGEISKDGLTEHDGKVYCPQCHKMALGATCYVCRKPIHGRCINAMGHMFHPEQPLSGMVFHSWEGKPMCPKHYIELSGTVCGRCFKPSRGKHLNILGRKWCEDHFRCSGCDSLLDNGSKVHLYQWDQKPFCKKCYDRLPLDICKRVNKYYEMEKKAERERRKNIKG